MENSSPYTLEWKNEILMRHPGKIQVFLRNKFKINPPVEQT
jgi:hypothetical protein